MGFKPRLFERFDDTGKIEIPSLCPLPGVLDNISEAGCKVHYNFPVTVELDNDYEIKIFFARNILEGCLQLVCHPQWIHEEKNYTEIGFKILPSKDYSRLAEYIKKLGLDEKSNDFSDEILESTCRFI